MNWTVERHDLPLSTPFGISRGTSEESESVVELRVDANAAWDADEACRRAADVPRLADACNVVNIKLGKCGNPRAARRLVHAADAHRLSTMLGCMVESNASLAAAVHLAPLVDYADLDGDRFDLRRMSAGAGARRR